MEMTAGAGGKQGSGVPVGHRTVNNSLQLLLESQSYWDTVKMAWQLAHSGIPQTGLADSYSEQDRRYKWSPSFLKG